MTKLIVPCKENKNLVSSLNLSVNIFLMKFRNYCLNSVCRPNVCFPFPSGYTLLFPEHTQWLYFSWQKFMFWLWLNTLFPLKLFTKPFGKLFLIFLLLPRFHLVLLGIKKFLKFSIFVIVNSLIIINNVRFTAHS